MPIMCVIFCVLAAASTSEPNAMPAGGKNLEGIANCCLAYLSMPHAQEPAPPRCRRDLIITALCILHA